MTDTDELIRAAIHELVATAPEHRELGSLEPNSVRSLTDSLTDSLTERMVPVSMNARTSTRRRTPAALGAVAVAIGVVGGIWYLTSDRTTPEPVVEQPTDTVADTADPSTAVPSTEPVTTAAPSTTRFAPPAVQRATIISPIPEGDVQLTDTEVLLRGDDRVVAVDTATATSRVVAPVADPARLVGVSRGSLVVEVCCDGELVVAADTTAAILEAEFDPETGGTTETPSTGWRFAAIQPSGDRLAAVVGSDLIIASTTGASSTVRSLLELGGGGEPIFGTVTDLGWTGSSADLVLVEERNGNVVVHRLGGSTGAHIDRAVVAPIGSVDGVSFAGPGPGRSFAVHVDAADGADDEVRIMDGTTLALLERVALPADTDQVRVAPDGSVVWTDSTGITIRHPDGSLTPVPLP